MKKAYDNRELSWLKFNERVLEEAEDNNIPPYERLKFVSIFHNNLDEFFMVRVASLGDKILIKQGGEDKLTGMSAKEQLNEIYKKVGKMLRCKDKTYMRVRSALKAQGVIHEKIDELSKTDLKKLEKLFMSEIKPMLSPIIIDELHPFPFLQNKHLYIGVTLIRGGNRYNCIIPLSTIKKRIIFFGEDELRFVLLEELIEYFIDLVFDNHKVDEHLVLRVTRNLTWDMDAAFSDDDGDLRGAMTKILKRRTKLNAVRLELSKENTEFESWIIRQLNLSKKQVFTENSPLDMSFGFALEDKVSTNLKFSPLLPQNSPSLKPKTSLFKQIQRHDVLLSYPYENIRQFIDLLYECATDSYVTKIQITLYRVASDSKIIDALCRAAENGKEVLALVELRARFDEENNIGWSRQLEEAGVKVIYGPKNLKVHSKLLLITRKRGKTEKYVTQIGTGNYNEKTSKIYTDLSLLTADKEIARDAKYVFSCLENGRTVDRANHLLVAPTILKQTVMHLIDEEIAKGTNGYIGLKMNSVCDKELIDKLIKASSYGVRIEMVVRGICCIVPGIEGQTDNIKLVSIVGRYLEHSRIYVFGKGDDAKVYISSADFMTRNTNKRIEVAAPVYDKVLKQRIIHILDTCLADTVKGRYGKDYERYSYGNLNSQEFFFSEAYENAKKKDSILKRFFSIR